jgi:hypothetical protein
VVVFETDLADGIPIETKNSEATTRHNYGSFLNAPLSKPVKNAKCHIRRADTGCDSCRGTNEKGKKACRLQNGCTRTDAMKCHLKRIYGLES